MSFAAREACKKAVVRWAGAEQKLPPELMQSVRKLMPPKNKVVMGRAKRGIYAGRHIRSGNRVSEDGGNKTRRTWKPNVQQKRLFSYIHNGFIRVPVTTHAIRCIDKAGGIDEYLLKIPYKKLDTELEVIWKARIERMYAQLAQKEVGFSPRNNAGDDKATEVTGTKGKTLDAEAKPENEPANS